MKILDWILRFFKLLFGKNADFAQTVLSKAHAYINKALPIVEKVNSELKIIVTAADGSAKTVFALDKAATFLSEFEKDALVVDGYVQKLTGLDASTALHKIAIFALLSLLGANSPAARIIELAVEFAYNIFSERKAAQAS